MGGLNLPLYLVIACAALVVGGTLWTWFTRDARSESDLGPVTFSTEVHVKVRRRPKGQYNFIGTPSGWIHLLVRGNTIAVRGRLPYWVQVIAGGAFTLDAANFTVVRARISQVTSMPGRGDEYVVLRGTDRRGYLEIGFKPRAATLEELESELLRAGVRSPDA